jgi:uncharacterized protein (DUF2252 family)
MTCDKLIAMAIIYHDVLASDGIQPIKMDENLVVVGTTDHKMLAAHTVWATNKVKDFALQSQFDLAHQWLGFVQAMMLMLGCFTIEEMRQHGIDG